MPPPSSSSSSSSTLDSIFRLLEVANDLEEKKENRIEAATKYYEAVYMIRRYAQRLPESDREADARQLLVDKATHYERVAAQLMAATSSSCSSEASASTHGGNYSASSPPATAGKAWSTISPLHKSTMQLREDSSVVPVPPPLSLPAPGAGRSSSSQSFRATASSTNAIHRLASQANNKLSQALDWDEAHLSSLSLPSSSPASTSSVEKALQLYMEAAELFLKAVKQAESELAEASTRNGAQDGNNNNNNNNINNNVLPHQPATDDGAGEEFREVIAALKRRLQSTLDRVEAIKAGKTRTVVRQHRVGDPKTTTSVPAGQDARSNKGPPEQRLTAEEISVLKRSSTIASGLFLPWSDDDARALSDRAKQGLRPASQPFTDPAGLLKLSAKQKSRFHKWARPSEIVRIRHTARATKALQGVELIRTVTPYTIRQQYVTDCSFIASLCICASYERRFGRRLVSSLLYPQQADGAPVIGPEGQYMVRLWLNGVARCVTIDDYLPIDKHGNLLCSQSSTMNASCLELWVCLIEKAYMKLCGGYDFPGSNSGVDLFSLTGWIPERILFAHDPSKVRDFETAPERAWERLLGASSYGDCLITVSTERLPSSEEVIQSTGLVTGHAYAVLSVIQTQNGTRLLQLKNPWAHQGWKGRFSPFDAAGWSDPAFCAEVGYDPAKAKSADDGVFWICWDDIMGHFNNFHLSWNPALFRYVFRSHGLWPAGQGPKDDTFNVGENPQYVLAMSAEAIQCRATVWIMVSRHVTKQEQEGCEATDFLTVHIHRNNAKQSRVWYSGRQGGCILTGAYTNNPHVLVRYDLQGPQDAHLTLVLSQYQKSRDLGYTLSCFCTDPFSLGPPASPELEHCVRRASAWTDRKSGGPIGTPSCHENPTFALHIPESLGKSSRSTKVQVRLTASSNQAVALNVVVLPVSKMGDGLRQATAGPVLDSGAYRHGFCCTEASRLPAGSYVVLASTYTPGMIGTFELAVASTSSAIQVQELLS